MQISQAVFANVVQRGMRTRKGDERLHGIFASLRRAGLYDLAEGLTVATKEEKVCIGAYTKIKLDDYRESGSETERAEHLKLHYFAKI